MVKKELSYTSTPPMGRTALQSLSACTRVHFTFHLHSKGFQRATDLQNKYNLTGFLVPLGEAGPFFQVY